MCSKTKYMRKGIDPYLKDEITALNNHNVVTVSCCCGHGKYPKTIVINFNGRLLDLVSNTIIPLRRGIYTRDPKGHYYIKEVMANS